MSSGGEHLRGAAWLVPQGAMEMLGNKCLKILPQAVSSKHWEQLCTRRLLSAAEPSSHTSPPGTRDLQVGSGSCWEGQGCRGSSSTVPRRGGCCFGWQHHHPLSPLHVPSQSWQRSSLALTLIQLLALFGLAMAGVREPQRLSAFTGTLVLHFCPLCVGHTSQHPVLPLLMWNQEPWVALCCREGSLEFFKAF